MRIHIIMPSVCSRKVAQLEWSGVRKGENVLQPFNLCDRLLGIHSASIFTRNASLKESGFGQKLEPVPTGVGDVYTRYQSDPHALVIGTQIDSSCNVSCWRDWKTSVRYLVPKQPPKCYLIDSLSLALRHRPRFYPVFGS